jgi:hypothetical protein
VRPVEIIKGPLGAAALFDVLSNSDVREKLRRYAHRHFVVYVDAQGAVVAIARCKDPISSEQQRSIWDVEAPGTVYFLAEPGMYASVAALEKKIETCVEAHRSPRPTTSHSWRTVNGERVLTIVRSRDDGQKK